MKRMVLSGLVGLLICTPAFAGGPGRGKERSAAKEVLDAQGRVWPAGVPARPSLHTAHPNISKPPRRVWKK